MHSDGLAAYYASFALLVTRLMMQKYTVPLSARGRTHRFACYTSVMLVFSEDAGKPAKS